MVTLYIYSTCMLVCTPLLLVSGQKKTRKKYGTVSNNGCVWRADEEADAGADADDAGVGAECARHQCTIAISHDERIGTRNSECPSSGF